MIDFSDPFIQTLFFISVIFSIISGILIILLLAVQSWVLVKLLPEIKEVSKNSELVNQIKDDPMKFINDNSNFKINSGVQREFTGMLNCIDRDDPHHIHTKECFS